MEVISPAEESVATGASTDNRENSISADEDPAEAGAEAKAECEPLDEHLVGPGKNDGKENLAVDIATTDKASSQSDNAETSSMDAAGDCKFSAAFAQQKELENVEITLVVEMSTDAEFAQDSGQKQEGSIEHCRDAISSVQALEQVGSKDSEMENPRTTAEAAESIQQKISVSSNNQASHDSSASSKMQEIVGRELDRTKLQKEVVLEEHASFSVLDEVRSFKSKEEEELPISLVQTKEAIVKSPIEKSFGDMASRSMQEDHSLSLLQTIEATSRSSIEEPLGATASGSMQEEHAPSLVHAREATARSPTEETLGDMTNASMHRSTTNEEKRTKQDVGDLVDMKVEAGSNIRSCSEKAAEEQVEEDGQHTSALSATEESLGDMTSGSMHGLMTNEEERTKQDVGDLGDMKVEASSDIRSCRKRAAEEQVEEDGRHVSALSDNIVDAERKKGRMAVGVSAPLNEEDRVSDLGTESDTMICTQSNRETNFVQGLESD